MADADPTPSPPDLRAVEHALERILDLPPAARARALDGLDSPVASAVRRILVDQRSARARFQDMAAWLDPPPTEPPGVDPLVGASFHQYRIERLLGRGGMGSVYLAYDMTLDRPVALKFLSSDHVDDASARAQLLREARAAAALDHPNVCTIYEVGESDDGALFISMAYYAGSTLKEVLAERGAVPLSTVLQYGSAVASALDALHRQGIVHRDLKPANVIVTEEGGVRLVDFGVALKHDGSARPAHAGTLHYMAPELLRGDSGDRRVDFWSLGVVLVELLTGQRPFEGAPAELIEAIASADPVSLHGEQIGAPPAVYALLTSLLAKDPRDRPADAGEILSALDAAPWDGDGRGEERSAEP